MATLRHRRLLNSWKGTERSTQTMMLGSKMSRAVRSNPGMAEYSTMEKPSVFSKTETGCLRGNRHLMLPTPVLGSTGTVGKHKPGRWGWEGEGLLPGQRWPGTPEVRPR